MNWVSKIYFVFATGFFFDFFVFIKIIGSLSTTYANTYIHAYVVEFPFPNNLILLKISKIFDILKIKRPPPFELHIRIIRFVTIATNKIKTGIKKLNKRIKNSNYSTPVKSMKVYALGWPQKHAGKFFYQTDFNCAKWLTKTGCKIWRFYYDGKCYQKLRIFMHVFSRVSAWREKIRYFFLFKIVSFQK